MASYACNIEDRLRLLIDAAIETDRKWKEMERLTGIASTSWVDFYRGKKRATADMIEATSKVWPQHAFWLSTGITDPDFGHVAPVSLPGYTVVRGIPQEHSTREFTYLIRRQSMEPSDEAQLALEKEQVIAEVLRQRDSNPLRATYSNFERAMEGYGEPERPEFYLTETDPELRKIRRNRYEEIKAAEANAMQWRRYVLQNLKMQQAMTKVSEAFGQITKRLRTSND